MTSQYFKKFYSSQLSELSNSHICLFSAIPFPHFESFSLYRNLYCLVLGLLKLAVSFCLTISLNCAEYLMLLLCSNNL
jgi:hypothetical protein